MTYTNRWWFRFLTQNRNPILSFFVDCTCEHSCGCVCFWPAQFGKQCIDGIEIYYLAIIKSHEMCCASFEKTELSWCLQIESNTKNITATRTYLNWIRNYFLRWFWCVILLPPSNLSLSSLMDCWFTKQKRETEKSTHVKNWRLYVAVSGICLLCFHRNYHTFNITQRERERARERDDGKLFSWEPTTHFGRIQQQRQQQ